MPLGDWLDDWDRGVDVARIISDKPTTITVTPVDGRTVAAQTVRIEVQTLSGSASRRDGSGGEASTIGMLIIGYKGHPTIADTDLKKGDRFAVSGVLFEVIMIQPAYVDRMLAIAEAMR